MRKAQMFQTATIWNIWQDTHRRYRFTGETERFACWLRLKKEQPKKKEAANFLATSVFKFNTFINYQSTFAQTWY